MPPKVKFINYPRQEKDSAEEIEVLMKHYKINYERARAYAKTISKEQLGILVKAYGTKEGRAK